MFIRDGIDPDARPRFVELGAPTDQDVAKLLDAILARVTAMLQKKGRLDDGDDEPPEPHLQMAMRPTRAPRRGPPADEALPRLCARRDGFSLHAGTAIHTRGSGSPIRAAFGGVIIPQERPDWPRALVPIWTAASAGAPAAAGPVADRLRR